VSRRGPWLGAGVAVLAIVGGCRAGASSGRRAVERPVSPSNVGLSAAVSTCLRLKNPAAGVPAYASNGVRLPFDVRAGHEPGTTPRCGAGELRVLRLETLTIAGRPTYVRRGGCQTPCVVRQATVHLPVAAFAAPVRLLSPAARHGDGRPQAGCRSVVHAAPQLAGGELARMFYKRPAETASGPAASPDVGARWSNYGDPGRVYRRPGGPAADYAYLLWNLPRTSRGVLHGGGIVRAVIARGQAVEICPTARLTLPAFDASGRPDGTVEFAYAEIRPTPREAVYGWVLVAYTYRGEAAQRLTT
jgi:hypothetical protein